MRKAANPRTYNPRPVSEPLRTPVAEQMELLLKGIEHCVQADELERKVTRARKTGVPLRVKVGFDPSAPDLHLGHTVVLRKMRHFQELGHEVIFLIGDFTARIGDPTGKKVTRPQLSEEEVRANAETYRSQVSRILDPLATRTDFNSRWLGAMNAADVIRLSAKATVAQLLERDDFSKRFKAGKPIALHELLYPLCQGYDSVALSADVEMGGTDQLFNLLIGRDLMKESGQEPQIVMTLPLLVGLDGVEKMSKSLGNAIGITEPPGEMFGKAMSISDEAMWTYQTLLTDKRPAEIDELKRDVAEGRRHPKRVKMDLARSLVADFHGTEAAAAAEAEFERRFARASGPVEAESVAAPDPLPDGMAGLLVALALVPSKNLARQKIREGAVEVSDDGVGWRRVENSSEPVGFGPDGTRYVRVGRRFVRVTAVLLA